MKEPVYSLPNKRKDDLTLEKKIQNLPQTVDKALSLLEYLAGADRPKGISELSDTLGINTSTVYRLVQALMARGYIRRDGETRRYRAGFKILELNTAIVRNIGLHQLARSHMDRLAEQTTETVGLAIMEKNCVIYLDQRGGEEESIRIHFRIGTPMPFHCTGTGKAMLAYLDEMELEEILAVHELTAYTPNTVTNKEQLKQQLKDVRAKGYAFNNCEYERVVRVIGAPIFNSENRAVGSVAVAAFSHRLGLEMVPKVGEQVKETAFRISRELGYHVDRVKIGRSV